VKQLIRSLCLAISLSACHSPPPKPQAPPPVVTDYTVVPKTIPVVGDFLGFAESSHLVEIRARVEGYMDKIAYQEGRHVNVGDLMYQLDPRQFQAKVEEAKGEVARQVALLENAKLTVNRLQPLYEQKAASKKDLDNAIANELATAAALQSAQANLLNAEINLGYTTITSPISGLSDRSKLREGALVNPAANTPLTTVAVVDPIWVYFTVSDNDILSIRRQSKDVIMPKDGAFQVEAILSDGSTFPYKGKVDFTSPIYDQTTGTMLVRAVFENPPTPIARQGLLHPGQFVRVKVLGAERPHAIVVPLRALIQKSNGMYVYLLDKDNNAIAQDVSTGDWYGDYQVITNGLKAGDRIIVDGTNKVQPGMQVHIKGPWTPPPEEAPQKVPTTL
jgi:membrane fusion protein (multidrug efflux system)